MIFPIFLLYVVIFPSKSFSYEIDAHPPFASALLVEAETGTVLFSYKPNLQRSPASTQKMLLSLVAMNNVKNGKTSLNDSVSISPRAAGMGGSQVFLAHNEVFTLGQLMEAVIIPSANDACVAVAEHVSGTVEEFVQQMNEYAQTLGLKNTHCVNVHGLDDTPNNQRNLTTASDLAQIARSLLEYPKILEWASVRYKPFRDGQFMLYNTNNLLGKYKGLDGIKTGYTERAGSCLVATALQKDFRLISIILGAKSEKQREQETRNLLDWGFTHFSRVVIAEHDELISNNIIVDWGISPTVETRLSTSIVAILNSQDKTALKREVLLPDRVEAPIELGTQLGHLRVSVRDSLLTNIPILASKPVEKMGLWGKFMSFF
ncbi:MAG: D-alanyl-D-alanine carboxypeptidase family protein [Candidatus Latescibacterota bacterium]|nr:D-alanyl-D-alanine carboxypeptidase family protein [Candidatus Latescibacterota bacterium]